MRRPRQAHEISTIPLIRRHPSFLSRSVGELRSRLSSARSRGVVFVHMSEVNHSQIREFRVADARFADQKMWMNTSIGNERQQSIQ
jgi:hypothetical protein